MQMYVLIWILTLLLTIIIIWKSISRYLLLVCPTWVSQCDGIIYIYFLNSHLIFVIMLWTSKKVIIVVIKCNHTLGFMNFMNYNFFNVFET
jgi:hypothetical protein